MATDAKVLKPSAKDLLTSLVSGKKPTKKVNAAATRPELELSPELETAFERFAGAKALLDKVEARETQEKDFLNEGCWLLWTERLWKQKNRPANPELVLMTDDNKSVDIQGIYQVQEWFSFNKPQLEGDESLEDATIRELSKLFVATGMSEKEAQEKATSLVTNELTLTPKPIIDLDRLVNGHYEGENKNKQFVEASEEEKSVAAKLIQKVNARLEDSVREKLTKLLAARKPSQITAKDCLTDEEAEEVSKLVDAFTDEDQEKLLEYQAQVVVKKGFLQRVCSYVNSLDQLRMIFTILKPKKYPQAKKFAEADSDAERTRRLLGVALDILGVSMT